MLVAGLTLTGTACSDPPQVELDEEDGGAQDSLQTDGPNFTGADTGSGDDDSGKTGGDSFVTLTFEVDDSANKKYGDADIYWTGSFEWDEKTGGIIKHTTSWLPEERSWPPLYDDGPISAGGHEKEGAKKGDNIFSTQVTLKTDADVVIEYGALNSDFNWMWIGPNGKIALKKGQSGVVEAKGLKLPAFGKTDLKLVLDTAGLHKNYNKWTTKTHKFYVKGTMNTWTPVQLLDDGKNGDDKAGDGLLTYIHSKKLGPYDGLLAEGSEVQFIFVTTTGDTEPKAGQEYKGSTAAYPDGVTAYTDTGAGKAWAKVPVELKVDSKGKFKNTAIIVPKASTDPGCKPACTDGKVCVKGTCEEKKCDPVCGAGQTCVKGVCEDKKCDPKCEAWQTCNKGTCEDKLCDPVCGKGEKCDKAQCVNDPAACSPACKTGFECLKAVCAEKKCDPSCGAKQKCELGKCIDLLDVKSVDPKTGPLSGGTKLSISGQGFAAPAKVLVGANGCKVPLVKNDKLIECETPKGDKDGAVDVTVEVAGVKVTKKAAFTYKPLPKPTVLLTSPVQVAVKDGQEIKGLKAVVKVAGYTNAKGALPGLKVEFGYGKPQVTHPEKSKGADAWKWLPATFEGENTAKGEEKWTGSLGKLPKGQYAFTARATFGPHVVYGDSDGSEDGVSLKKLGTATVQSAATGPTVTGFKPPWSKTTGSQVTILGENLKKDFAVTVLSGHASGKNWPYTKGTVVKEVTVGLLTTMPKQPPGTSAVEVKPPTLPAIKFKDPLYIVPWGKPKLDGSLCYQPGCSGDWDATGVTVFALTSDASQWSAKNDIIALTIQLDDDNLYLGVQGTCEAQNAIALYLDVDYGPNGGGTQNPLDLKDNKGAVDDAISSVIKVTDKDFGADFAFATIGMASFTSGKTADSTAAGWRGLHKADDFSWLPAPVHAKAGSGVETAIPLKTLFPKGIPANGTTIAIAVTVLNKNGAQVPKMAQLPVQGGGQATTFDKFVTLKIFPTK